PPRPRAPGQTRGGIATLGRLMDATDVRKRFAGVAPLFIDGKKVPAAEGKALEIINPADGSALAQVAAAGGEDIDRAVRAARRAFGDPVWRKMPASKRGQLLWAIADAIDK